MADDNDKATTAAGAATVAGLYAAGAKMGAKEAADIAAGLKKASRMTAALGCGGVGSKLAMGADVAAQVAKKSS